MLVGTHHSEEVEPELRQVVVLDGECELTEVAADKLEDKASVHEGEGIVDKESQAGVETVSIAAVLRVRRSKGVTM